MKIVIFDFNLKNGGHYRYFNWHIAKLFDESGIEIIFADYTGYYKRWYEELSLTKTSFKITKISGSTSPKSKEL